MERQENDSVAQLVEQYTFNVWALGSNPSGITKMVEEKQRTVHYGCPHLFFMRNKISPGGEIGRHVRLRGVFRKMCWFESSPGHPGLLAEFSVICFVDSILLTRNQLFFYLFRGAKPTMSHEEYYRSGGIGRRARFRCVCREA